MWKKFLNGLVFGAGFAIAFMVVWTAYMFMLPDILESRFESHESRQSGNEVTEVPSIEKPDRYLGSTASYSGDFRNDKSDILAGGPSKITGSITANNLPVEGLKLRLALNGSVMSQWAITDASGTYEISVPYGKYAVDGFELDHHSANKALPNKIILHLGPPTAGPFDVSEESHGHGLDLAFVDPIVKKQSRSKYSVSDEVILEWEPYPDAAEYVVQVHEKDSPNDWSNDTLFDWSSRPVVSEPRLNLKQHGAQLTPGKFYSFTVTAKDKQKRIISENAGNYSGYDFEVVE